MNNISINGNITTISNNIKQLQDEILVLRGSLRVFENLRDVGIEKIPVKQETLLLNQEVVSHVQGGTD